MSPPRRSRAWGSASRCRDRRRGRRDPARRHAVTRCRDTLSELAVDAPDPVICGRLAAVVGAKARSPALAARAGRQQRGGTSVRAAWHGQVRVDGKPPLSELRNAETPLWRRTSAVGLQEKAPPFRIGVVELRSPREPLTARRAPNVRPAGLRRVRLPPNLTQTQSASKETRSRSPPSASID